MNFILKITLKSDLCVASGDGFSDNIDTDVVYDKYGLPFIPAKRIKGCLRDAAKPILSGEVLNGLFGVPGMDKKCGITISNATIFPSEQYREITENMKTDPVSVSEVLEQFTYTRAQTQISETGTAQKDSLRFTRVVSHYSPLDLGKETVFYSKILVDDKYSEALVKSCKALRNIGFNRNRGLGAIRCELVECQSAKPTDTIDIIDDAKYEVSYYLHLDSPLMISENNGKESVDYIPGKSMLGFFAGKLINSAKFEEIFLKNNVIFSNLYPVSDKNGTKCIPAIALIGKNKTAEKEDEKYKNRALNNSIGLKPLKKGYIDGNYWPYELKYEITYHNNLSEKNQNGENILYTQYCISEGQIFYGTITGEGRFLKELMPILQEGRITLGRSKTAQYSLCSIEGAIAYNIKNNSKIQTIKDEKYVYIFDSDAVLLNRNANYIPSLVDIKEAIDVSAVDEDNSALFFTTITGYNSKRNQKNPHARVIKKGSCLVFDSDGREYYNELYIGEKQSEGFGKLVLKKVSDIIPKKVLNNKRYNDGTIVSILLENASLREENRKRAIEYATRNRKKLVSLTASLVGRVSLMIEQSECNDDLIKRIESIKNEDKRKIVKDIIDNFECNYNSYDEYKEYIGILFILAKYYLKQGW